jgi:hypothetical protein
LAGQAKGGYTMIDEELKENWKAAYDQLKESLLNDEALKKLTLTPVIKSLAEKTHEILTTFVPIYPNQVNLSRSTGLVHYWYYDAAIMYDMRAVMKTYAPAEDFAQWDILCKKAIPYHRMSLKWMTVYDNLEFFSFPSFLQDESLNTCVSMFVPQNNNTYHSGEFRYNTTYSLFEWNRILDWSRFGW